MIKHNKGPWSIWSRGSGDTPTYAIQCSKGLVASTLGGRDEGNAKLIAMGPEFYDFVDIIANMNMGEIDDDVMDTLIGTARELKKKMENK